MASAEDQWARMQATLRAIERGERLEVIDDLLIRQVLKQPPPKPPGGTGIRRGNQGNQSTSTNETEPRVDGNDAYRALLELRRHKRKQHKQDHVHPSSPHRFQQNDGSTSPSHKKTAASRSSSPTKSALQEAARPPIDSENDVQELEFAGYRKQMKQSLKQTQQQRVKSKQQALDAQHELDALVLAAQSVLSSRFLFERNFTQFCQERPLEVIQRVLQRLQHRFYKLYFLRWVDTTAQLCLLEQQQAVTTIVRVFRGHLARKLRRILRREADKVNAQARQIIALRVNYRQHQAAKIQRVWRRHLWTQSECRRQRRRQAAVYLQRQWKDRKVRRNALIATLLNVKQILAAIKIQKIGRGFLARRRVKRGRREAHRQQVAMAVLLRNTSREALLQWKLERHGATFVITSAMYPMLLRERFRRLARQLKRQKAAKMIAQCVGHWYRTRFSSRVKASVAQRMRELMLRKHQQLDKAADVIQKYMQRWWLQREYAMAQRRRKKLARLQRLKDKAGRKQQHRQEPPSKQQRVTKATAGLADVMKQVKKKPIAAAAVEEDPRIQAAAKVQRSYRAHRVRHHFTIAQYRRQACRVEVRVIKRRRAAISIQKIVRGWLARRVVRRLQAQRMLVQWIRRWKWRRVQTLTQAASRIQRWLKQKKTQQLAKLWRHEKQRQIAMATRIQRWLRWDFFYRHNVRKLLSQARKDEEARTFARQSLVVCEQHFTDALILQSMQAHTFDDGIKSFVQGLNSVMPMSTSPKPPRRARFPVLPLIFVTVCGFKTLAAWSQLNPQDLLHAKMERSKLIALFRAANKHTGALVPSSPNRKPKKKNVELFTMTEVDLAMAKAAGASKRALTFPEFIAAISIIADTTLSHISLWWSKYVTTEARLLAMLWHAVFPIVDLEAIVQYMQSYTTTTLTAQACVIQRLFQRLKRRAQGRLMLLQRQQQREIERKRDAITTVQAHVRRLLARKIYKQRVQAVYLKYVDPDWSAPYWINPRTGYSTWAKPWVLEDDDVETEVVPYPASDKAISVPCQGKKDCTSTCSDWFCYECDEFFCAGCLETFHRAKGESHEVEKLRKCGLCKFQLASRRCHGCVDAQGPQAVKARDDEVLFCDVCYAFAHKHGMLVAHKWTALVDMCADCLAAEDATLDQAQPPAMRSLPRAAQWVCKSDAKRVCSHCAWMLHPVETCGELTRLPIATTAMRQRADRLAKEQEDRERNDTEYIKQQELELKRHRAAKKIQLFWHNAAPLTRARRVARTLREQREKQWIQRKADAAIDKTLKYQVKNALGIARSLPSDTAVQRRLRDMSVLQQRQLSIRARMFGLLIGEYMELGVPLPGVAKVVRGNSDGEDEGTAGLRLETSEDLRGWLLNRQTLRLKRLPPKNESLGTNAKRKKGRGEDEEEKERAWQHDLRRWRRDTSDTKLLDIDPKKPITERRVPLAPSAAKEIEGVDGEEEFVLFLVEFSMDPMRVVWISHSLAERFAVWRRRKMREHQERRELSAKAKATTSDEQATAAVVSAPTTVTDATLESNEVVVAAIEDVAVNDSAGDAAGYPGYGYDYTSYSYGYDATCAWGSRYTNSPYGSAFAASNTGYNYSAESYQYSPGSYTDPSYPSYVTGNGYSGDGSSAAVAPAPTLVDSTSYFNSEDGNAAAWEAYYQAHPEAYASPAAGSTYDAYDYSAGYGDWQLSGQQSYDSSATGSSAAQASLPLYPWEEVYDPVSQQTYYYNHETQATAWEYPYPT